MFEKLDVLSGEMKASSGPYISSSLSSTYPLSQFILHFNLVSFGFLFLIFKKTWFLHFYPNPDLLIPDRSHHSCYKYAHEKLKDLTL
jgi:hypothetical protein